MSVAAKVPGRLDAERAAAVLASEGARKVMLFGSVASGDATQHSDIDLVAIYDDLDYRHRDTKRRELTTRVEHVVGYEVDVVVTDWPEWKLRSENLLTSLESRVARDGVVLIDKGVGQADWEKQMVIPTNGYEATVRRVREVAGALTTLHMCLIPGEMEREARSAGISERTLFLTVLRFEGACGQVQRTVESTIKALAHVAGRRRALYGHDIAKLCGELVEPYRGEITARIAMVGAEVITRWHQDARYTSQHVLDDLLTPERVRELARVACKVATYMVDQLDDSVPIVSDVHDAVEMVEQYLDRCDPETGADLT